MREVSGSTWVLQIMLIFILIFACFLTLVINYSKAYRVKNEMLSIIEKYEGVTPESVNIINNYLSAQGYKTVSKCPEDWHAVKNYDSVPENVENGENYLYCFKEESVNGKIYYNVTVFYKFSLPFLGDFMTFKVNGRTETFLGSMSRY